MDINDYDAGAYFKIVGGGGARGVAAGTGDNTAATGVIVDMQAQPGLKSGFIFVAGSATLAATKLLAIKSVKIEHGADSALGDAADAFTAVDFSAVATGGTGGSTEQFGIKLPVHLSSLKRYWRVSITPDLDATGTDTFQLGFGVAGICEASPQS